MAPQQGDAEDTLSNTSVSPQKNIYLVVNNETFESKEYDLFLYVYIFLSIGSCIWNQIY